MIDDAIMSHEHTGSLSKQIQLEDVIGLIQTVDVAADLTNKLAETPRVLYEQMFIDTTTATKKLYIYDVPGDTWYSVTIT